MLKGTWIPQGAEFGGQPLQVPEARLIISEGHYCLQTPAGLEEGTLRVDATANPAEMDFVGTRGAHAGRTIPAIFRLRGNLLQVCYRVGEGVEPQARPRELTSALGTLQILLRYRRIVE